MSVDEAFYNKQCSELTVDDLENKNASQLRKRVQKCNEQSTKYITKPKFPFIGASYYINWISSIIMMILIWLLVMSGIYWSNKSNIKKSLFFVGYTLLILFLPNLTVVAVLLNTWLSPNGSQTLSIPGLGDTEYPFRKKLRGDL